MDAWNMMWMIFGKPHPGKGDKHTVVPAMDTGKRDLMYASHVLIIPPRARGRQYQTWSLKAEDGVLEAAESKIFVSFKIS